MLIARQNGQVHRIQHIGHGGLAVFRKAHGCKFLHLVRVGEGGAVQSGNADFLGIGVILKVRFAAVDIREGQPVRTHGI